MLNSSLAKIQDSLVQEPLNFPRKGKTGYITDCSTCVFGPTLNKFENNQTCLFNRIEKFGDLAKKREAHINVDNEEVEESYTISGVCNLHRPSKWMANRTLSEAKKDATKEILTTYLICIIYNKDQDLEKTLKSLVEQEYPIEKVLVIPTSIHYDNLKILTILKETLGGKNIPYKLIIHKNGAEEAIDQYLFNDKPKPFYYFFLSAGNEIPPSMLQELDTRRNEDLEKIVACTNDEENFIIHSTLFWQLKIDNFRNVVAHLKSEYPNTDFIREFTF